MIPLAIVTGARGIRGEVKLKSFTEVPEDVAAYGPLRDEAGREYRLRVVGNAKGNVVVRIDGVGDRNAAEALKGRQLMVARSKLPAIDEPEAFYREDLIGLEAVRLGDGDDDGETWGQVRAVHDFGAGDILEIAPSGGGATILVPFTRDCVPTVDIGAGRIAFRPLDGLLPEAGDGEAAAGETEPEA
ncbi:ribosome maturation factor RimM [Oceanibacterium hippocampi]|uniref:Ribosome maturation factor RimM n=1 Tax=Oceanibacterium hippocampi TaxID=745714 RepID=A0A1Y5RCN9_9PROT|nr:ribosome maturation factor RimM [Oceanibacterium hippocampi]SLN14381.1 Ribosome maturation factor RimM [Oceanibacterium hippocampi]